MVMKVITNLFTKKSVANKDEAAYIVPATSRIRPAFFLLISSFALFAVVTLTLALWHIVNQQQLEQTNQNAQQNLALYSSKIERELGLQQQSLLPIVARHPDILNYLTTETQTLTAQQAALLQLNLLHSAFENKAVFIGNNQHFY